MKKLTREQWIKVGVESGYIPDCPVWLVFDLMNGHPGIKQYVWWFRTRKEAFAHIRHVSKMKYGTEYSDPILFVPVPSVKGELDFGKKRSKKR